MLVFMFFREDMSVMMHGLRRLCLAAV